MNNSLTAFSTRPSGLTPANEIASSVNFQSPRISLRLATENRSELTLTLRFGIERLLAEAGRWIFIGYSLPGADFELKQVLKAANLRMLDRRGKTKKSIEVIVLNDLPTQQNFERFFGVDQVKCFQGGLPEYIASL
jgi:hypothetical protein